MENGKTMIFHKAEESASDVFSVPVESSGLVGGRPRGRRPRPLGLLPVSVVPLAPLHVVVAVPLLGLHDEQGEDGDDKEQEAPGRPDQAAGKI